MRLTLISKILNEQSYKRVEVVLLYQMKKKTDHCGITVKKGILSGKY